jgi:hypothetical protein
MVRFPRRMVRFPMVRFPQERKLWGVKMENREWKGNNPGERSNRGCNTSWGDSTIENTINSLSLQRKMGIGQGKITIYEGIVVTIVSGIMGIRIMAAVPQQSMVESSIGMENFRDIFLKKKFPRKFF